MLESNQCEHSTALSRLRYVRYDQKKFNIPHGSGFGYSKFHG